MWKKADETNEESQSVPEIFPSPMKKAPTPVSASDSTSSIGSTISIEGVIKGSEDLMIRGEVQGEVSLPGHTLTIGLGGKVRADITAKVIHVEGIVIGDMTGMEQVLVHQSGEVRGNINAPRVKLEDGAKIKGSIDTDSSNSSKPAAKPREENSRKDSPKASSGSSTSSSTTSSTNGAGDKDVVITGTAAPASH